jgi:hypothetical protein
LQLLRSLLATSALFALTSVAANASTQAVNQPPQQHQATQQNQGHVNGLNTGGMNQGSSSFHQHSLPVMVPRTDRHEQLPSNVSDFRKDPSRLPIAPIDPKLPDRIHINEPIQKPVEPMRTPDQPRTTDHKGNQGQSADQSHDKNQGQSADQSHDKNQGQNADQNHDKNQGQNADQDKDQNHNRGDQDNDHNSQGANRPL